METQTYDLKCSKCEKILGQSSIENHQGFLCQNCDDEIKIADALSKGKNYDTSNLAIERPERLQEIVKAALFENPSVLLSWNFSEHVEESKAKIQSAIGLDDLEYEQKVEVLQKIKEKNDITKVSDEELKNKVDSEKQQLPEKK